MSSRKMTQVQMGEYLGRAATGSGLWSNDFGTCVGVVVTGKPNRKETRFLYHISLDSGWEALQPQWNSFVKEVEKSGMTSMKGYMLTVDTTLSKDPESKKDPYMLEMAANLEPTYSHLFRELQHLVRDPDRVIRATHSFARTSEMSVDTSNKVLVDGHSVSRRSSPSHSSSRRR